MNTDYSTVAIRCAYGHASGCAAAAALAVRAAIASFEGTDLECNAV